MNRIAIDPNPTVNTNYGLVQGLLTVSLLGEVYQSFQGIPYAKPPLGELRFKVNVLRKCFYQVKMCARA